MAAHAKAIGIWWLAAMAALTTAVIAVVLVVQADSGEASPPQPSPFTAPPTGTPGTTGAP
ncbi:MAG: hypothetical protein JF597_18565 [Streptomyces sp.]|uniref:hypothetical protein n=1 Tax=Streptomyces sp. TaxID=1931 RepID=UPI0025FA0916|nr:hypothetical protein [Streptomyces sp.]MBW8795520.1 hypothetical protein [Streptomyces sp.]